MKEYFYKSANVTYYMENNEFFKNSEQLTLIEEDKTFDITDFKKLIQQDLNAILHTKFDNITLSIKLSIMCQFEKFYLQINSSIYL